MILLNIQPIYKSCQWGDKFKLHAIFLKVWHAHFAAFKFFFILMGIVVISNLQFYCIAHWLVGFIDRMWWATSTPMSHHITGELQHLQWVTTAHETMSHHSPWDQQQFQWVTTLPVSYNSSDESPQPLRPTTAPMSHHSPWDQQHLLWVTPFLVSYLISNESPHPQWAITAPMSHHIPSEQ